MSNMSKSLLLMAIVSVSGCANLSPEVPESNPPIPEGWGSMEYSEDSSSIVTNWREFIKDEDLKTLVDKALDNNRDLQVALLNVLKVQELHQIQESERYFSVDGSLSTSRERLGNAGISERSQAVGSISYELDLFNKARNLSKVAWQNYLSEGYNYDVARVTLISEVVTTYLDLVANKKLLELSRETLSSREESYKISNERLSLGQVSALSLAQERGLVETARNNVAAYEGLVKKGVESLRLLVGESVDDFNFNTEWNNILHDHVSHIENMPSTVLLNRPDVRLAESRLLAKNANIGVARAMKFPSITLTGQFGTVSSEFSDLMSSGTGMWGLYPTVNIPIFNAGRLKSQERVAEIEQKQALSMYEKAIQEGFREVSNILIDYEMLNKQQEASSNMVDSSKEAYSLSRIRYDAGLDDYFMLLDAERTLYGNQINEIVISLSKQ